MMSHLNSHPNTSSSSQWCDQTRAIVVRIKGEGARDVRGDTRCGRVDAGRSDVHVRASEQSAAYAGCHDARSTRLQYEGCRGGPDAILCPRLKQKGLHGAAARKDVRQQVRGACQDRHSTNERLAANSAECDAKSSTGATTTAAAAVVVAS